jgi:4-nitrophenyl phosphatase
MPILKDVRGMVVDMDGVLWRGEEILPGAAELFAYLQSRVPYVFATNNSSRTVAYYLERFHRIGIPAESWQVVSSAVATAEHLARLYPPGSKAYVVGGDGIKTALQEKGFILINTFGITPDVVVSGIDRTFTYQKLHMAITHIRNGAKYFGTNGDVTFPIPGGVSPGAGSIAAAIATAAEVEPVFIGKPAAPMFEIALSRLGTSPERTLMIGDRYETDILGAHRVGMKTALVLSGISTSTAIMDIKPDFVFADLAAVLQAYQTI